MDEPLEPGPRSRRDLTLDLCACGPDAGPGPLTEALLACPGVDRVHVDRFVTWALVSFDDVATSAEQIVARLGSAGFDVVVAHLFDRADSGPG